jgi:hypothetical protein
LKTCPPTQAAASDNKNATALTAKQVGQKPMAFQTSLFFFKK